MEIRDGKTQKTVRVFCFVAIDHFVRCFADRRLADCGVGFVSFSGTGCTRSSASSFKAYISQNGRKDPLFVGKR